MYLTLSTSESKELTPTLAGSDFVYVVGMANFVASINIVTFSVSCVTMMSSCEFFFKKGVIASASGFMKIGLQK